MKRSNFNTKITKADRSLHDFYAVRNLPKVNIDAHRDYEERVLKFDECRDFIHEGVKNEE